MSRRSEHRPPPPAPQPSTVVAEPATPEACAAEYAQRGTTTTTGQITATPHTHGRQS